MGWLARRQQRSLRSAEARIEETCLSKYDAAVQSCLKDWQEVIGKHPEEDAEMFIFMGHNVCWAQAVRESAIMLKNPSLGAYLGALPPYRGNADGQYVEDSAALTHLSPHFGADRVRRALARGERDEFGVGERPSAFDFR